MNKALASRSTAAALGLSSLLLAANTGADSRQDPQLLTLPNPLGLSATFSADGPIDKTNPFFQKLGVNGRSCDTCPQPGEGWSVTPAGIRERFDATVVVDFYDERFGIGLDAREKEDLAAFLRAL